MFTTLLTHLWNVRVQFVKYCTVGSSAVLLDMGLLILFTDVFHWSAVLSVAVNQIFLIGYTFGLNKYWSFQNKDMPHKQLARYVTLVVANYTLSVGAMYVFHDQIGFDYRLVRLGSIAVMVSWNFLLYKHWVYANEEVRMKNAE